MEITIKCPKCKHEFALTESITAPIIEAARQKYDKLAAEKDAEIAKYLENIKSQERALKEQQEQIDKRIAARVELEKQKIAKETYDKVHAKAAEAFKKQEQQIKELKDQAELANKKIEEAAKTQAEAMRKERELAAAQRELELTIEKRLSESLNTERERAKKEAEEAIALRLAEKEQQILSMAAKIDELKKKAELTSQQLSGEVQELKIEAELKERFTTDIIEEVPKGICGADCLLKIAGNAGTIVIESKRTKAWSDGWLQKLRDDTRAVKGDIAVLITQTLPKTITSKFDIVDGVWVTSPENYLSLISVLRYSLIELSVARKSREGQKTKMEMLYEYLTGPQFKARVQSVVERLQEMKDDLEKEKRALAKTIAKREQQLNIMVESLAGLHGDVSGIAGKNVLEIETLSLNALPKLEEKQ